MRIALDAMGGDYAPHEVVLGAVQAAPALGAEIALVGEPERLTAELKRCGGSQQGITIVPASEVIGMGEAPAQAVRRKRDSSLMVAMEMVRGGEAAAFVSAGNTGAVMAAALLVLGRIEGIDRPALGILLPGRNGTPVLVLDAGANADCRPEWLVQFAQLGSVYMTRTAHLPAPRVALLNIGEEESKGNQLAQEAYTLLKRSGLNFTGNVEGRDLTRGLADVIVTDGFTGNVVLKTSEGVADFILTELQAGLTAGVHLKLAAALLRGALQKVARRIDFREYGGAPLLGVNGVVIIGHGRSNSRAIASALRTARDAAAAGVVGSLTGLAGVRGT
jgi:glycerol-3-phosphate acyltransferase PlsX